MSIQSRNKKANISKKSNLKLIIICAVCALVAAGLTVALIVVLNLPERIIYDRTADTYTNEKTGVKYYPVVGLEPVKHEKDVTAVIVNDKHRTNLYEITGLNPAEWLADDNGTVYCAESLGQFDLSAVPVTRVDICREEKKITSIAQIADEGQVKLLKETFANGETIDAMPDLIADKTFMLRISLGGEYEGLFYCLKYVEYLSDITNEENSRYLIKDTFNEKIVVVKSDSALGIIIHDIVK